jgi:hypothetical protein
VSPRDDLPPALTDLRRQLHEAAVREMAAPDAPPARRRRHARRRWRRAAIIAIAIAVALAGVAGAARLIGVGEPVKDTKDYPARLHPAGSEEIAVRAQDPSGGPAWAVAVYDAKNGQQCALAGRERGGVLGLQVSRDEFRPFANGTTGMCARLNGSRVVFTTANPRDMFPRSVVYGRAGPGIKAVRITVDGQTQVAPVGSGAFLAVYEGTVTDRDVRWKAIR